MSMHVHEPVLRPSSEIAECAREFHPVRFTGQLAVSVVGFIFMAAGWLVGSAWFLTLFTLFWVISRVAWTGQCFAAGVRHGARVAVEEKEKP